MLSLGDVKVGSRIIVEDVPYVVLFSQHSKMGRAGAVLRTKLKNILTGAHISKTFQGSDKFEQAVIETKKAQYLYLDGNNFNFMNSETYEQFEINSDVIKDASQFLTEGTGVEVLYYNNNPVNIELPIKMDFEVIESPPAVRGNTADGGSKIVTIETGSKISVPLFVKSGDRIRINTQTNEYAERV